MRRAHVREKPSVKLNRLVSSLWRSQWNAVGTIVKAGLECDTEFRKIQIGSGKFLKGKLAARSFHHQNGRCVGPEVTEIVLVGFFMEFLLHWKSGWPPVFYSTGSVFSSSAYWADAFGLKEFPLVRASLARPQFLALIVLLSHPFCCITEWEWRARAFRAFPHVCLCPEQPFLSAEVSIPLLLWLFTILQMFGN